MPDPPSCQIAETVVTTFRDSRIIRFRVFVRSGVRRMIAPGLCRVRPHTQDLQSIRGRAAQIRTSSVTLIKRDSWLFRSP